MSTYLRSFVFSLIVVIAIAAPQISSADCATVSGGTSSYGGSFLGGSIGFGDNVSCGGGFGSFGNMFGLPSGSIYGIIATIIEWLLAIFGLLGILGFVISGVMYLVSAGDEDMAKRAKKGLIYSIIGIIVGLSGYVVMQAISGLLTGMGGAY